MKPIATLAVVLFTLVALAHLMRVALGWSITVDGFAIPAWASVVAGIVAAALAVLLWRESRGY